METKTLDQPKNISYSNHSYVFLQMLNYLKQLEASEKLTPMHDSFTIKINVKDKKK
jgi:hypothetical protein